MPATRIDSPARPYLFAWLTLPLVAIALAWVGAHGRLALHHPRIAALLFLWIAADGLVLSLVARSRGIRPSRQAVLARLAAAATVVLLAGPPAVRTGLAAMPALSVALALTLLLHTGWSLIRAVRTWRDGPRDKRWYLAATQILPGPLLQLIGWRAARDVPQDALPFAYHRHLAPMMGGLLALQAIEIGVLDMVLRLWSPLVANLLLELGMAGLIFSVGLIRSLRLRPILLGADGLLIRSGVLAQQRVDFSQIAEVAPEVTAAEVNAPATRNMALLAWPNVIVRLARPIERKPLLRSRPAIRALAFRVDDPAAFHAALAARLPRKTD